MNSSNYHCNIMKIIILFEFFTEVVVLNNKDSNTILENVLKEDNLTNCMLRIWRKYPETYTLIISDRQYAFDSTRSMLLYSEKQFNINPIYYRFNMFIFLLQSTEKLESIMHTTYNSVYWNSKAKFLLAYHGSISDLHEIFNTMWYFYALNLSVIASNGTDDWVYTFFPYKDENCGIYDTFERITSCTEVGEVFPQKIPLNVHGCPIKMLAYWMPPYVIDTNANRENPALAGIEVTAMHILKERMNFTENYIKNSYAHWGHKYNDGHYTFMYADLFNRKVDLIYGFTYANSSYIFDFDASYCYLDDLSFWLVPIALPIAQWKNLTAIFEWQLWAVIFIMLFVNGFAWWLIGRRREKSDEFNDVTLCVMNSLYTLLQGSVKTPQKGYLRIVFALWLMSSLLIFTAHQSQLISILTTPLYNKQIKTLDDLMQSDLHFGFFPSLAEPYIDSDNWIHKKLIREYVQCPVTMECVNRTAYQRDFAVIKNRRQTKYFTPRYYTTNKGQKMLYETNEVAIHIKHRFHMIKGFPLYERIDKLAMLLESSGLISKWDIDIQFKVMKVESESDHKALSLNHLQAAFYVWLFGIVCSIVVFILEKIIAIIVFKKHTWVYH